MSNGANSVHQQLLKELEDYIKTQYFGKTPLLLSAVNDQLHEEGVLYQKPYIESSPAYKSIQNGIQGINNMPDWLKEFFKSLADEKLGVYSSPFVHQVQSLEETQAGNNLVVATGTGSGKTECFMWPLLAKLATEAKENQTTWNMRGVRTIIMYPMNALVSDQVSRLRRLIGDPKDRFVKIFRDTCGRSVRRPQFGMYTGRTPYPGEQPNKNQDHRLEKTLSRMSFPQTDSEKEYFEKLQDEGKIPAKADMKAFLSGIHESRHIPDEEDAELITRFEIQQFCPDILITNYSMLEYMLLRPRESKIWSDTKAWLNADENNKLLFVIDEAHMYRGSSGGEVALLIRRLFHKLGISRKKVQFILTTASMPDTNKEDKEAVIKFARDLTSADDTDVFHYLTGEREEISGKLKYDIPISNFKQVAPSDFEGDEQQKLNALNLFWKGVPDVNQDFKDLQEAYNWMYDHLIEYRPFHELIKACRGNAVSLQELANSIFPNLNKEDALQEISTILAIAPLAKSNKGVVLFPARMHMLFRGIKGVYACSNPDCYHAHSDGTLTLGDVFLTNGQLSCPHCDSIVYELYNDRRCGALFYKGYILDEEIGRSGSSYLWHYPGQFWDARMKEIHLYIPPNDYKPPTKQRNNKILPCYLDIKSGFINFHDDSLAGQPGIRKLYYCYYSAKGRPGLITFPTCPHCRHLLSSTQLTSFSTRGNQSFFSLTKSQFEAQPAVPGKDNDPDRLPNEGRKVLVFSDSRQRAAKLARDMSEASDNTAARQLFTMAISEMEKSSIERSMNDIYDYFCLEAAKKHVQIFHEPEREKFAEDCAKAINNYNRAVKRNREYTPRFTLANAPLQMQKYLLRLFAGGYNTLYEHAISWLEPTDQALFDTMDTLEDLGVSVTEEEFLDFFNAWITIICDRTTALGHTIPDVVRLEVRPNYGVGYGIEKEKIIPKALKDLMGWNSGQELPWISALKDNFLDVAQQDTGRLYIDLSRIKPRLGLNHDWYRCEQCTEIMPRLLNKTCYSCGSKQLHKMEKEEYEALDFWLKPINDALSGMPVKVIDTEEHTAQLSHKDQRDDLWSKTETYELRFQDLIQGNETPVDILSSTTTMEVGIDIGSLVAVGLRNIPPMRENYQQRAGRAGRRGSSLSTIVTFCEDGPHDTLYFNDPAPMFRGEPRRPWIDIESEKLLQRHLTMVIVQEYLAENCMSLDSISAATFIEDHISEFLDYVSSYRVPEGDALVPTGISFDKQKLFESLKEELDKLTEKYDAHPELFGVINQNDPNASTPGIEPKTLLDAFYEEGIIPTFSFPKNVASTYIVDHYGKMKYEVERGLDIAIGEYAPGRSIVVDKATYQIGGFYYPGSERRKGNAQTPARSYVEDSNYLKRIIECDNCGWFGLAEDNISKCPFCESSKINEGKQLLRPWGFAPQNATSISEAQLNEQYSYTLPPLYSTLASSKNLNQVDGYINTRIATRANQRIIMVNKGVERKGFVVCKDCGAAMPGDTPEVLKNVRRPYKLKFNTAECRHPDLINVNLGYDFITDMLVLEIALDKQKIKTSIENNPWLIRAGRSLAEALRLAASKELDIEFTELVTGYRVRNNPTGSFIDIYLYDNLSSGAGYSVSIAKEIKRLLSKVEDLLNDCNCRDACYNCLKHYRNQFVHGELDRFAALELLEWAKTGKLAEPFTLKEQQELLRPLQGVLQHSGCDLGFDNKGIVAKTKGTVNPIYVYPAMWTEPKGQQGILISDADIKYMKPYVVDKILRGYN